MILLISLAERKLFSNVPNLRFPTYVEKWKSSLIDEISQTFSGGTPLTSNKNYYDGSIPFIRSGEIGAERTELFLSEEGLKNSSAKMVSKGDVLLALYGATSGEIAISLLDGAINQAILCIKTEI